MEGVKNLTAVGKCRLAQGKKGWCLSCTALVESARSRPMPPVRGREAATRLPGWRVKRELEGGAPRAGADGWV